MTKDILEPVLTEPVYKISPLELHLANQLGQENLQLVVAKLNEVISYISK